MCRMLLLCGNAGRIMGSAIDLAATAVHPTMIECTFAVVYMYMLLAAEAWYISMKVCQHSVVYSTSVNACLRGSVEL